MHNVLYLCVVFWCVHNLIYLFVAFWCMHIVTYLFVAFWCMRDVMYLFVMFWCVCVCVFSLHHLYCPFGSTGVCSTLSVAFLEAEVGHCTNYVVVT